MTFQSFQLNGIKRCRFRPQIFFKWNKCNAVNHNSNLAVKKKKRFTNQHKYSQRKLATQLQQQSIEVSLLAPKYAGQTTKASQSYIHFKYLFQHDPSPFLPNVSYYLTFIYVGLYAKSQTMNRSFFFFKFDFWQFHPKIEY